MGKGARIGVDVGGTFTDLLAVQDGEIHVEKVPSTPDAPDEGVGHALDRVATTVSPRDIEGLVHGTTVATNTVLEGEWAETALVTTEGCRDVLEIGRQTRPSIYALDREKPEPIVPRQRRYGVPERLDERGGELQPVDEAAVTAVAESIADGPAEAVAVCLLFAFEDSGHEETVRDSLEAADVNVPVTLSSAVHPEIREYERSVTTAMNAALVPVMRQYLGRLKERLSDRDVPASPTVMSSSGGSMTAAGARDRPVRTLLSGPAAGVRGAAHIADLAGAEDVITMDMGGTSCDVSLVEDGDPVVTTETTVGDYPVAVPAVDIETVGAGGGSIARVDSGGALRVGPPSAGAEPGPICYGRGGRQPTTTDAHVVLDRIDPDRLVTDPADRATVEAAVGDLATEVGTSLDETAAGILRVANANMERALRVVSVERGRDPRELTLVAFGGAGPLHAPTLAAELGIPRVLVPPAAGVLSALGLLASDVVYDASRTRIRQWEDLSASAVEAVYDTLETEGRSRLKAAGIPPAGRGFDRTADLRYLGQSYTVGVPVPGTLDEDAMAGVADRFHAAHDEAYGHAAPAEPVELETLRLRARGRVEAPALETPAPAGGLDDARLETRSVGFGTERYETPILERDMLGSGTGVEGPAIIQGAASTIAVPPAQRATVDGQGIVVVEVSP